jgi:hypothetical protein
METITAVGADDLKGRAEPSGATEKGSEKGSMMMPAEMPAAGSQDTGMPAGNQDAGIPAKSPDTEIKDESKDQQQDAPLPLFTLPDTYSAERVLEGSHPSFDIRRTTLQPPPSASSLSAAGKPLVVLYRNIPVYASGV